MKRKILVKKRGFIAGYELPATIVSILLLVGALYFGGKYFTGLTKTTNLDLAISEAVNMKDDVTLFSQKASQDGEQFVHFDGTRLNAEKLQVYTKLKFSLNGTSGASSYFCSQTSFGCKLKYYFSTGANDDTWSIFIDAQNALATYGAADRGRYENEIERGFSGAGYNPVVDHSATTVSAITTDVTASVANSEDGVFEIGNL